MMVEQQSAPSRLNERLGYAPHDRILIVNADDFGMSLAANRGIHRLLNEGAIGSATLMTPCSWAPQAAQIAAAQPELNIGVHLVFTSEWNGYRWRPIASASAGVPDSTASLVDALGYFPADCATFEQQADPDEVRKQIEAQIQHAMALGVDPSHVDNHMGSLYGLETGRDFLEIAIEACAHHRLPFRLPRVADLYGIALPEAIRPLADQLVAARAAYADQLGVVIPDYTWTLPFSLEEGETRESVRQDMLTMLTSINSGVTEVYIHPFEMSDELRAMSPNCEKRAIELELFSDPSFHAELAAAGIHTATWRDLRDVMRRDVGVPSGGRQSDTAAGA
ncbi:polysaccharide deacetylase family protein [Lysinibacter cavernae]|uniref:ChbG/HpnK family deacetylase n=1 Tax=Lysinibacter cavernae TaxID=1640652 RepID=A0A7X5QYU6_9MICO|nr:polysaccharide deacetylase family protein [Lysinibacter cavernae]NIH52370.1 hypothetical protein [Lysinibacter cavernae]